MCQDNIGINAAFKSKNLNKKILANGRRTD